jgi:hypothetical protein
MTKSVEQKNKTTINTAPPSHATIKPKTYKALYIPSQASYSAGRSSFGSEAAILTATHLPVAPRLTFRKR